MEEIAYRISPLPPSGPLSTTNQLEQSCALLQLPSEIRNRIYDLVFFSSPDPIADNVIRVNKSYTTPSLLSTCKQLRIEAGGLYYGTAVFSVRAEKGSDNQFVHRTPSGLCVLWLVTRAFEESRLVRRVRLEVGYTGGSAWMDVWRRIALQIVRDQIERRELGEKILVDAVGGEVAVRAY